MFAHCTFKIDELMIKEEERTKKKRKRVHLSTKLKKKESCQWGADLSEISLHVEFCSGGDRLNI